MMRRWRFAWKMSIRTTVLLMGLMSAALLFGLIVIDLGDLKLAEASFNGIEVILPLIAGMSAALLFAPEDEPALELLLSSPRPTRWLLYERLIVFVVVQLGVGVAASAWVAAQPTGEPFPQLVMRWLAPTIVITGVSLWASVFGRRTSYGLLMAIVICAGMAIANDVLLVRFPELWTVIFYVQPRDLPADQYALNRLILIALGGVFMGLVLWRMGDHERLLGTGEKRG